MESTTNIDWLPNCSSKNEIVYCCHDLFSREEPTRRSKIRGRMKLQPWLKYKIWPSVSQILRSSKNIKYHQQSLSYLYLLDKFARIVAHSYSCESERIQVCAAQLSDIVLAKLEPPPDDWCHNCSVKPDSRISWIRSIFDAGWSGPIV